MPNRLSHETSPYLKQHADNPVDWYPWGEEALARARGEDKPILLSVGYSACHWCHVMAHESFEDAATASLMNERFINIKVDREERPDLDHIYQNVAQAMTGGGGWPLTVFLTPDLKPFFGGTYFPPVDKFGRPGFPKVLTALSDAYKDQRDTVAENAEKLTEFIRAMRDPGANAPASEASADAPVDLVRLQAVAKRLASGIDWTNGGFGGAPKFPNTMGLTFLWRMGIRDAAILSLTKMATGGIYDQLGGGFSRYSVDERWAVPHFEKMLYDNALLLKLYSEVALDDPGAHPFFIEVIEGTLSWALREMRSPGGGFYAAQDADSEGEEGKFFVFTPDEIAAILPERDARVFNLRFGVTSEGNFEHGATVLAFAHTISEVARQAGISESEVRSSLEVAKRKVLAAREKRVRPGLDDKILTSWNGLMISGLAWASAALARAGRAAAAALAREAALDAWRFIRSRAVSDGKLHATFQADRARFNAYLDDYAAMANAALDLLRMIDVPKGAEVELMNDARAWVDTVLEKFSDPEGAGYFFTASDHEKLLERPKALFDSATPSGTSMMLGALAVLAELDPDGQGARYSDELERQLRANWPLMERQPHGFGETLCAALLAVRGPITVTGPTGLPVVHPHVFRKPAPAPWLVCHRKTCSLPIRELPALETEIRNQLKT